MSIKSELKVQIATPMNVVVTQVAASVILPGHKGRLGILEGHEKMIFDLQEGMLEMKDSEEVTITRYNIGPGTARTDGTNCVVLTQHCKKADL